MQKLFFFTRSYEYLSDPDSQTYENGVIEYRTFDDGEFYQRIVSDVRGREVVIVAGTISDTDTIELYDIASGCAQYGALSIELVIPYFGYSTMERATHYGEIVKAKSRATLLSEIPRTSLGTTVYLFDLHSEGIPYYFDSNVNTFHLRAEDIWKKYISALGLSSVVIGSTDVGRAKWVEKMAQDMHTEAAFIYKRRTEHGVTTSAINADVQGKNVVIYDDMIRSGNSMMQAIESYQKQGAADIYVIATHGLMMDDCTEKILSMGVQRMAITNSHPDAVKLAGERVDVLDIAPLITTVI